MAGITQHIPNFIKGISRQPDELKMPGQVRDCKNALPDVTAGLQKRPGARLLNPLGFGPDGRLADDDTDYVPGSRRDGKWFDLYVGPEESYIGQINKDGRVEVWSTWDGLPRVVKYDSEPQDFGQVSDPISASPSCNSEEFAATRDELTRLDNEIEELEVEIDVLKTKLEEQGEGIIGGSRASYRAVPDADGPYPVYVVDRGMIYDSKADKAEKGKGLVRTIAPPIGEEYEQGGRRLSDVMVLTPDGYLKWKNAFENSDNDYANPRAFALRTDNETGNSLPIDPDDIHDDDNDGDIDNTAPDRLFKMRVYDFALVSGGDDGDEVSQGEIDQKISELNSLKEDRDDAFTAFVLTAAACGTAQLPDEETMLMAEIDKTANVLPYLQHRKNEELQTLSIQDRVMVINRQEAITMSESREDVRPCEAFLELKGVAGNRVYEFEVDLKAVDVGFTESSASKLTVAIKGAKDGDSWVDDEGKGTCIYSHNEIFQNISDNNGPGVGLGFELNTVGSSQPKNPKKPEKGYECEYTTTVKVLNGGQGWRQGDQVVVEMKDQKYKITVKEVREEWVGSEFKIYSDATSADGSTELSAQDILNDLKAKFDANSSLAALDFTSELVGNGLYIKNDKGLKFTLKAPDWDLLNAFGDMANDVTDLPTQCKAGYLTKVANTAAEEDDYYVQFFGTDGKPYPQGDITPKGKPIDEEDELYVRRSFGSDGPGAWYEVAKPGLPNIINHYSMPHQIRRVGSGRGTEFLVQPINWSDRMVGDDITNPVPRFCSVIKKERTTDGLTTEEVAEKRYINNAIFYRNRLCFLTGDAIVMSQPMQNVKDERFDFWKKTATTLIDTDPIDMVVTTRNPTKLYDALVVNNGLLLFSGSQQYLLSTNQDILSPKTAEVNEIASYRFNEKTTPISMGTTVGFISNAGVNSRLFEMTKISRDTEAEVLEQSKIIADIIPKDLNLLAHSKENTILLAGEYLDRNLWIYRYFNDGVERKQSAWVRWELTGDLVYHTIIDDVLFIIVRNFFENRDTNGWEVVTMQRIDLKESVWTSIVEDYTAVLNENKDGRYTVHMDNYRVVWPTDMQYYPHLDQTYFRLPLGYFSDKRLAAYTLKYGKFQGRAIYPTIELDNLGTWCVLDGNWSDTRLMIGYEFEYGVELPTLYPIQEAGKIVKSNYTGSLILHRMHISFGANGVYETSLVSKTRGSEVYTKMYEARPEDDYLADDVAFDPIAVQTVPIYDRNTNFQPNPWGIFIKSNHPSPCTLVSMTWEGDYSDRYYKRV